MNNEINLSTETAEQNKNKAIAEIAEQKENNETNQASKVSLPVKPVKPLPAMDRADIIMAFAMLFAAYIGTEAAVRGFKGHNRIVRALLCGKQF